MIDIKTEEETIYAVSQKAIEILKYLLKQNNKIILIHSRKKNTEAIIRWISICERILELQNIIILTDLQEIRKLSDKIYLIATKEMKAIQKLYRAYEFSNRVVVVQQADIFYGNLMNYIRNGLLTEEECFRAFLEN